MVRSAATTVPHLAALLFLAATTARAQTADPLMQLTAPAGRLPAGCRLVPPAATPSEFLGVRGNPSMVMDRFVLGFMASLMVPPTAEEMAAPPNKPGAMPDTQAARIQIEKRADAIEAGYVAGYQQAGAGGEIGVYGLRFKQAVPPSLRSTGVIGESPARALFVTGRVAILTWVDGKSPACFAGVKDHLRSVQFR